MLAKLIDYPGPLWRLYSFLMLMILYISIPIWGTVILIRILLPATREVQSWYLKVWLDFIVWIYRIRFDVSGLENFDASKAALIIANHQSGFDIHAAFRVFNGHIRMVAKRELFLMPFFGHVLSRTEFISVDRRSRNSGQEAADSIRARVLSGMNVWVAPEGTRANSPELLPFKKGAFGVAIMAQIPIQPLLVENAFESTPNRALMVRPGTVIRVHVLPRISTEGLKMEDRALLAESVRNTMNDVLRRTKTFEKYMGSTKAIESMALPLT